jgi:hypothetical protein
MIYRLTLLLFTLISLCFSQITHAQFPNLRYLIPNTPLSSPFNGER